MGKRLYVGNLAEGSTEADLRRLFAPSGRVLSVDVMNEPRTGCLRGCAFLEMGTEGEANTALSLVQGSSLNGRPLDVRRAGPQVNAAPVTARLRSAS